MNEAVVEGIDGMGCIVNQHAAPERRLLSMETYSKEAMTHYVQRTHGS
jgi:hypothetical protein